MKRKAVSLILGGMLTLGVWGSSAQAMTYGYSLEDGSSVYVIRMPEAAYEAVPEEDGTVEYGTSEATKAEEDVYTFVFKGAEAEEDSEDEILYDIITGEASAVAQVAESSLAEGSVYLESEEKIKEYAEHGIDYDETAGAWLWDDEPVFYLLDENGGLYTNNSEECKKNKIYLLVKRDAQGEIEEVKQITAEDIVRRQIIADMEKEWQTEEETR